MQNLPVYNNSDWQLKESSLQAIIVVEAYDEDGYVQSLYNLSAIVSKGACEVLYIKLYNAEICCITPTYLCTRSYMHSRRFLSNCTLKHYCIFYDICTRRMPM